MRVDREMDTFPTPKKNPDGSIAVNEGRDFVEVEEEEEPFVAPHFSSCCTHVSLGIFFLLLLLLSVINHEAIDAAFYYNDDVLETLESTTSYPETFPYLSEYPELQYSLMIDHNHKQITGSKKPVAHVPQMKDTQDGRSFMSADRLSEYRLFAVPKLSDGALEDNYASKLLRDNDRSFAERCKKSTAQRSTTTDGKLPRLKVSLDTDWNTVREMHFEPFDYSSGGRVEVDYSILPHVVPDWEEKQQKNKWFLFHPSEVSAIKEDLLLQFRDFSWNRFYLALNLYNNEDYIPYLTGALVSFFQDELEPLLKKLRDTDDTAGGSTLERSVIISIYLNEDKQETALLVKEFLLPHLKLLPLFADTPDNTNKIYLTTKGSCLKHNYKRKSLDRIEWLACVRNKALEPLYEDGMALFGVDEDKAAEESRTMAVLFLNDILFQPRDLITLLNSKTEAEIAKQEFFVYPRHDPTSPVVFDENENNLNFNPNVKNVEMTGFDMACGMDFYTFFYDTLVSRDIEGRLLLETYPYTMHKPTRRALRRILFSTTTKTLAGRPESIGPTTSSTTRTPSRTPQTALVCTTPSP
ncbi:hypothetical protein AGDE_15115 [Angomonas deanei]|uniref:Cryptococcal mannosyltransferase 1, putative n=1 Tax=Angomonas deanei TaxID=59799 RepID=A0A7G2CN29_9TRYP|nr:hypothetical protein AGDE_15115 [Angomonas deanei]CAD2219612.1 Cryptococcal mannosyltransferase 1, putative [Angomonas deanei]|eukprot:EPY19667.1 hypothetical protein AGDE_15115 [Angomonas deanei]